MAKKARCEEQILRALHQAESGERVADICREHGVSEATFYVWKKKYSGLALNELRELRQLREENAAFAVSTRRVSGPLMVNRATMTTSRRDAQTALKMRLRELSANRVRFGYRRLTVMLRREGRAVNAKRIYRLYTADGWRCGPRYARRSPDVRGYRHKARRDPTKSGQWILSQPAYSTGAGSGC
jgi:transposase-like protein